MLDKEKRMKLIMIHQHDPTVHHVGGIGTFIDTFIRNAPEDIEIQLLGVTAHPERFPVGRWHSLTIGQKQFQFFPLAVANPARITLLPLSVRMVYALQRYRKKINIQNATLEFHRIEPMLAFFRDKNHKILFLHGHNMRDFYNKKTEVRWGKFPWLYFWLEKKLFPQAKHIYIVREDAIEDYKKQYPTKKNDISFLPTWADETNFYSLDKEGKRALREKLQIKLSLPNSSPLFLYVGRYEGQKDPLRLLGAFKLVKSRYPNAVLILVGEGSLKGEMEVYVRENDLSEAVRFLPSQSQEDIGRLMNSVDALCLSSAFEGMPRVVVEALHCGLPVVSTAVGESVRLIGDSQGGRLVTEDGAKAFSEAMIDLIESPPSTDACRDQVAAFTARKVLGPVYKKYCGLSEGNQ